MLQSSKYSKTTFYTRYSKMPFFIVQYYLMANDGHKYLFSGKRNSQDRASWPRQKQNFISAQQFRANMHISKVCVTPNSHIRMKIKSSKLLPVTASVTAQAVSDTFLTSIFLFHFQHSPRRFHFAFEWRNLVFAKKYEKRRK